MLAILHAMAVSYRIAGLFALDLDDDAFSAGETTNGQNVTGTLSVADTGAVSWTGDLAGTNESGHTWWSPISTVEGTWHVRLTNTGGTDQYSSGDGLNTWDELDTTRTWTFLKTTSGAGGGNTVGTYLLEFSDDAGSTTHASVTVTITLTEPSI